MTAVRASCLVGALLWVSLHVTLGVLFIDAVANDLWFGIALALFLAATAQAVRPLVDPARTSSSAVDLALALSVPAVQVVSLAALEQGTVASYANWASGGTGVILASLVLRGHGLMATAAGSLLVVVQTCAYAAEPGPAGFDVPTAVLLAVPPQLWLAASWAVRRILRNAHDLTSQFQSRAATAAADTAARADWARVRRTRLRELEANVLPFLAAVAEGEESGDTARARASLLARELRDALRARALLDGPVRDAVAAARGRGVLVTLSSEADEGPVPDVVREALPDLLAQQGLQSLSLRVTEEPLGFTCVVTGDPVSPATQALRGRLASHGTTVITELDDTAVVSFTAGSARSVLAEGQGS